MEKQHLAIMLPTSGTNCQWSLKCRHFQIQVKNILFWNSLSTLKMRTCSPSASVTVRKVIFWGGELLCAQEPLKLRKSPVHVFTSNSKELQMEEIWLLLCATQSNLLLLFLYYYYYFFWCSRSLTGSIKSDGIVTPAWLPGDMTRSLRSGRKSFTTNRAAAEKTNTSRRR